MYGCKSRSILCHVRQDSKVLKSFRRHSHLDKFPNLVSFDFATTEVIVNERHTAESQDGTSRAAAKVYWL